MAWRNVWRNPRRTILTICAIAFACILLVFMVSWQLGSYETMINAAVDIHMGHLQIQAKGYQQKHDINLAVSDPRSLGRILDKIPEVSAYTYRADAFTLASSRDRTYGVLVIGIDPEKEAQVSTLKRSLREGRYLSEGDTDQALVGKLLARNLRVRVGDELVLLGQGRDGSVAATVVRVKGIYSSGQDDFDRSSIQIPLGYFQDTYAMGDAVHEVVIRSDTLKDVPIVKTVLQHDIKKEGRRNLDVLDWTELMPGLIEVIQIDVTSGFIFYFVLIIVVAFSILNTFLMAILERKKEFGVFMAMGTTPTRLVKLLLMESTAMTLIGIVVGTCAGILLTWYFQVHGIFISGAEDILRQYGMPERIHPRLSIISIILGPSLVLVITFLTALYPALRVRRLRPVEAISST
ncbi:MAG: FtsX-like permease family protein [Smithellaceae bacterium]|nr:FtsX-like permease family protein [Smithellaceae bacterium]